MDKKQTSRSWLKTLLIVENVIIIAVLLHFGVKEIKRVVSYIRYPSSVYVINIHRYPDKLVYVAGEDTVLDLTGGELCLSSEGGFTNGFPCEFNPERKNMGEGYCEIVYSMTEDEYETNADLSVPGRYYIRFSLDRGTCSFPIIVIDPKDAVR